MSIDEFEEPSAKQATVAETADIPKEAKDDPRSNWAIKVLTNINPMTGVIGFFRAAALGDTLPWTRLLYSSGIIVVVFFAGLLYFRRVESAFADVI